MPYGQSPPNLAQLHIGEEFLRSKAVEALSDDRLRLHAEVVEHAMHVADSLRQFETDDEDLKLIQVLAMRTFNAFGASFKLCLSGYYQNAALIMRDVLETTFLIALFRRDRALIPKWRTADIATRLKDFRPLKVRTTLDEQDGFTERKRGALYSFVRNSPVMHRWRAWPCLGQRAWKRGLEALSGATPSPLSVERWCSPIS